MKTKKAKRVKVEFRKIPAYRIEVHYQCPSCKTEFTTYNILAENVTRFICDCGQELIVERRK